MSTPREREGVGSKVSPARRSGPAPVPDGDFPFSVTLTAGNYVVSRSLEVSVGGG